jgi:hypothetical protein
MSLQTRWLEQLLIECKQWGQKANAWDTALKLAQICPDQLSELPSLLTQAMQKRGANEH